MGRSPGFGSNTFDFIRPVQTCFRCGSAPEVLNLAKYIHSPDHSTKGTRSSVDGLSVLVNTRFQVLFHSPPGVLFTFPSQYFFSIGHRVVFRLGGWSPRIPTGFHVWIQMAENSFRLQDSHLLWLTFPCHSAKNFQYRILSVPRKYYYSRFGLFRVRSPLLAESLLISFPRPT